jgi:MFS family permease
LLHGLGWGFGSTATSTVAADIIPKKRFAEGMGYFAMTNAVASALAPALSIFLIQDVGAVYMLGVSASFTLLALVLAITQAKRLGKHVAHPAPATPQQPGAPQGLDAFFERRALLPSIAMLLVNIGFGCITTFIALHAAAQGVHEITWYFIVYAITTVASRPLIGKVIDRRGYRGPSIFATLFTAATLVFIGLSDSLAMFCLAGAFAGLGIGTAMGTFQAMAVATVPPFRRGVATSTYFVFFDLGIAIGSFMAGILAGAFGYAAMYQIIAIFPVLGCIFFLVAGKQRLATTRPNAEAE